LYPHTPDNSFLGFAMEMPEQVYNGEKKEMALIYGKKGYMFRLSMQFHLQYFIFQYREIHVWKNKLLGINWNKTSTALNIQNLFS